MPCRYTEVEVLSSSEFHIHTKIVFKIVCSQLILAPVHNQQLTQQGKAPTVHPNNHCMPFVYPQSAPVALNWYASTKSIVLNCLPGNHQGKKSNLMQFASVATTKTFNQVKTVWDTQLTQRYAVR